MRSATLRPALSGRSLRGHVRACRMVRRLPNMTTPMRMAPWTTVDRFEFDAQEGQVGSHEGQDEDRDDGSGETAPPPARLTPPSTMAATPSSV